MEEEDDRSKEDILVLESPAASDADTHDSEAEVAEVHSISAESSKLTSELESDVAGKLDAETFDAGGSVNSDDDDYEDNDNDGSDDERKKIMNHDIGGDEDDVNSEIALQSQNHVETMSFLVIPEEFHRVPAAHTHPEESYHGDDGADEDRALHLHRRTYAIADDNTMRMSQPVQEDSGPVLATIDGEDATESYLKQLREELRDSLEEEEALFDRRMELLTERGDLKARLAALEAKEAIGQLSLQKEIIMRTKASLV